jgi:hypothetical protein
VIIGHPAPSPHGACRSAKIASLILVADHVAGMTLQLLHELHTLVPVGVSGKRNGRAVRFTVEEKGERRAEMGTVGGAAQAIALSNSIY